MLNSRHLALDLVEQIFDQGVVQRTDQEKPSPRRVERQPRLQRVPQQASHVVNFLQRKLMVTLPTSAKLKSEVPTRSVGRHRVGTGTVSPGGPDLQRQIEFHTRPVLVWPEFVVGRSKCIQQRADDAAGAAIVRS
jgi:hypothetical protein